MSYGDCKVYSDGSHYIAIPPTKSKAKRRKPIVEEVIEVKAKKQDTGNKGSPVPATENDENINYPHNMPDLIENSELTEQSNCPRNMPELSQNERSENVDCTPNMPDLTQKLYMTKKELFNKLYDENINVKRGERRKRIIEEMKPYFESENLTEIYVDRNMQRRQRNLICRRIRLTRKINLQAKVGDFNYFCTFTYDSKLHDEESFKKKLKNCLAHFSNRKGWRYVCVWERSPEKHRLHLHGLFYIPDGTMPGEIIEVNDYSFKTGRRQITRQNTFFNKRIGRSDFETVDNKAMLGNAVAYIVKYLEKTGERIMYSKGLPQYFKSDIMDEDIVCAYGEEDNKLLLFDDFVCWDEGEKIGKVSGETISKMPKCN